MKRNLLEVFGQRDPERRKKVISEIYTEECIFYEGDEKTSGVMPSAQGWIGFFSGWRFHKRHYRYRFLDQNPFAGEAVPVRSRLRYTN